MTASNIIPRGMRNLLAAGLLVTHLFLSPPDTLAANPAEAESPLLPSAKNLDPGQYRGKNLLLFFYALDESRADSAIILMNDLYALRKEYNFEIAGVSLNEEKPADVLRYNKEHGVSFPVFLDQARELSTKLKMKGGLGVFIYNKKGTVIGDKMAAYIPPEADLARIWLASISRYLKIPYIPPDQPLLGIKPPAPVFEAQALGGATISIQQMYKNKPLVMLIFSPKCSHCQDELDFLNSLYNDRELKGKFEILAISRLEAPVTLSFFQNKKYLFPAVIDTDNKFSSLFPSFIGSVPLSYLVDRQGRINFMHNGFTERSKDNYIMEIRKLCGLKNSPRLNTSGYSGQDRCMVCHEKEHLQWRLSRHSDAFLSLIRKGKEDDPACVSCHVTGFGKPGGYSGDNKKDSQYGEGVQCEACHGPGYE
ncbi:MAG: redoxin domain-containing protein, partial [Pseudomonadota bacterium]